MDPIYQAKDEKGLEFGSKMVRRKFWEFFKNESAPPEPTTMFSVILQDPVEEAVKAERSKLLQEKEALDYLKSSPVNCGLI